MNKIIENIITRRSVKRYKSTAVPESLVREVAVSGTYAPSGMNRQAAKIIAVTNKDLRDRLSRINQEILGSSADPFYGAPVVLVVLARKDVATRIYDGSLVMENMMLAAHSLGLGSCWIHRAKQTFEREDGREILSSLGIDPDEYEGIGNCVLGYAEDDALKPQAPRKDDYIVWAK